MPRVAILLLLLPAVAAAQGVVPCSFVVSRATLSGDASQSMRAVLPTWFTVSGRAEVEISGKTLRARFFDSRVEKEVSHIFTATLAGGPMAAGAKKRVLGATLRTLGTDSGDDVLSGEYSALMVDDGGDKFMSQSLSTHNAGILVGITCYAKRAA